ncbi:MAG TPA: FliG C-terminal domain-containing protein [Polyangiaceae bacterium]|nr:FliG C-terminal domain-containing protein [Polyangiaceae bacterium]
MELTGPEKAVLLLLSLDETSATPIIAELEPGEVRKLREVASMMRAVPTTALDKVYGEFVQNSREAVAVPRGGVRYLRRLATRALGEAKTQEIFVDAPQTAMERLAGTDAAALALVLENEHPQLIAAVLSQLDTEKAARVVQDLPEATRTAVLERLGRLHEVPAGLLEEIASALTAELPSGEAEAAMSVDGISRSAALVRRLGRETGELLLGALSQDDATLATQIRKAMYSVEDLRNLDARALRVVLEAVPADRLTLAMKTASEELKEQIFRSMSKRAADRIREDMGMLGGVRLADVEAAQQEIVEIALRLDAEGTISLEGAGNAVV